MTTIRISPKATARLAAVLFLVTIVAGILAQVVIGGQFIVANDAGATSARILANPSLYRLGFTVYLIEMASQVAMTVLFYGLLAPVNKSLSLTAAAFGLVGCGIKIVSRVFYYAPLYVLGGSGALAALDSRQLESIAMLMWKVNDIGAGVALVFFGFSTALTGWLMIRATWFPSVLGVLSLIGGIGWLSFLSPPFGLKVFPIVALVALVGSVAKIGYMLVKGLDEARWNEATARS